MTFLRMREVLIYLFFAVGAWLSLLNFYISFIRMRLLTALGRSPRRVSGFPLFGSVILVIGAVQFWDRRGLALTALAIAALDTGGIHWFLGTLLWMSLASRRKKGAD